MDFEKIRNNRKQNLIEQEKARQEKEKRLLEEREEANYRRNTVSIQ
jgi:hypothetical protein